MQTAFNLQLIAKKNILKLKYWLFTEIKEKDIVDYQSKTMMPL
jgi:hypothetical protein